MAEYRGRKVTLNKPRRIRKGEPSYGKKKSMVYVMDKGKVRKSFRARHNCDTATDKTTARYWSCKAW